MLLLVLKYASVEGEMRADDADAAAATFFTSVTAVIDPMARAVVAEEFVLDLLRDLSTEGEFSLIRATFDILGPFSEMLNRRYRIEVKSSTVFLPGKFKIHFSKKQRAAIALGLIDIVMIVVWNRFAGKVEVLSLPATAFITGGMFSTTSEDDEDMWDDSDVSDELKQEASMQAKDDAFAPEETSLKEQFDFTRAQLEDGAKRVRAEYVLQNSQALYRKSGLKDMPATTSTDKFAKANKRAAFLSSQHESMMELISERAGEHVSNVSRVTLDMLPAE